MKPEQIVKYLRAAKHAQEGAREIAELSLEQCEPGTQLADDLQEAIYWSLKLEVRMQQHINAQTTKAGKS